MSLTSKYRVFIWDFDGTLYDTYPHTVRAYVETLSDYGIVGDAAGIERIARRSLGELQRDLEARYALPREYFAKVETRALEYALADARPFDDARLFVEEVAEEGGKNMLFSHRDKSAVDILRAGDFWRYFSDALCAGDPDFAWKPSPDGINALLHRNGAERSEAIMVGDREIDVASGANAGIDSCLIMPYDITADTAATYKCESFAALREILG